MSEDTSKTGIQAPELEWLEGSIPRSPLFQDTYFSKAGGLEETRHVFLKGNGLPDRWAGRDDFVIGELGFGTGLNFLTTLEALSDLPASPKVTFLSFELYPLTREQLATALSVWSSLEHHAQALLEAWEPTPGWNRLDIAGHRLLLAVGDARQMIGAAGAKLLEGSADTDTAGVDAWFLDGFAPSRNPELWQEELLQEVHDLTVPGGTLATYTAAGWVRRTLQTVGFDVEKLAGFAGKREMVTGRKRGC